MGAGSRRARAAAALAALACAGLAVRAGAQVTAFTVEGQWDRAGEDGKEACSAGQFFDVSGLECKQCPVGTVQSEDGFECLCKPGFVTVPATATTPSGAYSECYSCEAAGMAVSSDLTTCMACDNATSAFLDASTGQCKCPSNQYVLLEFDPSGLRLPGGKQCYKCPKAADNYTQDTFPDPSGAQRCVGCPLVEGTTGTWMVYSEDRGVCECPASLPSGASCVDAGDIVGVLEAEYNVNLISVTDLKLNFGTRVGSRTVQSRLMSETLLSSAWGCHAYGNRTSCNALANLCVLSHYDSSAVACKLYEKMVDVRKGVEYHSEELNPEVGWSETLPWLWYDTLTPDIYLEREDVGMEMTFSDTDPNEAKVSDMVFVLSVYRLDGSWAGFVRWDDQLQACGGATERLGRWARFGTNYHTECELPLTVLVAQMERYSVQGEPLFFDIYLQDLQGGVAQGFPGKLYPVPVKNLNQVVSGVAVNANGQDSDDRLSRRFFAYDASSAVNLEGSLEAVRVLVDVELVVETQKGSAKIYPPVLSLGYIDRQPPADGTLLSAADAVEASFEVAYTGNLSSFWEFFNGLLITTLVLSSVVFVLTFQTVQRRRQNYTLDESMLLRALEEATESFSTGLFIFLFIITGYWYVFFKLQDDVYTMLPKDSKLQEVKDIVLATVLLSAFSVALTVYRQTKYDIFFLDWEKSREVLGSNGQIERLPVSVWRQLFMCNEWQELQTVRMTDTTLTLVTTIFMLEGMNIQAMSKMQPNSAGRTGGEESEETSLLLRFFLGAFFYTVFALAQAVYKVYFHHKYVAHPFRDYVDLLSIANISILIFDDVHAGYYLHGHANAPGGSDADMYGLVDRLRKEQEAQVSGRGLVESQREDLNENSAFELYVPRDLRQQYETLLLNRILEASRAGQGGSQLPGAKQRPAQPVDATLEAAERVKMLFVDFVNDVTSNAGTCVREKQFSERMLHSAPDMALQGAQRAVLLHDFELNFTRCTFYGIEVKLLTFEVMSFCALDLALGGDFATAGFLTYLFVWVLTFLRDTAGATNVSQKALIDPRFLI